MLKKITAVLCAVSIFTMPAAFAAKVSPDKAEEFIDGLGIKLEMPLTKEAFVQALGGFIYDNPEEINAEDIARQTGLAEAGVVFNGKEQILLGEALEYAVITLGYGAVAEASGGYPVIAAQLGLNEGIAASESAVLGYNDAVRLLYNMTEAAPLQNAFTDKGGSYAVDEDVTLLELNRDIYKVEGMISANEHTGLYSEQGTGKQGYIELDGVRYYAGETDAENMLGLEVIAYVQENKNNDYTILYVTERKNKNEILEIDAADVAAVSADFSRIRYIDGDRYRDAELETALGVIYNGVSYGEYTVDDLNPDIGSVRLVDNNGNGKYDIAFVSSYETVIVDSVDAGSGIITNKYSFAGCIDRLSLDTKSAEPNYTVYGADGKETDLSSIQAKDVLSVARSKNDKLIRIYISGDEMLTGKMTARDDDENVLYIDELDYPTTPDFINYLSNTGINLKYGGTYVFYFDTFGNVAYAETVLDSEYSMLYRIRVKDDSSEVYEAEFMDMDGAWHKVVLAEKVKLDDTPRLTAERIYDEFKGKAPSVVKLQTNSDGEIKAIDTAKVTSAYNGNEFTRTATSVCTYRYEPKCFDMKYYLSGTSKVIVMPDDASSGEDYYISNNSYFSPNTAYTVEFYDMSELGFVDVMAVRESAASRSQLVRDQLVVVSNVMNVYSENEGAAVLEFRCSVGEYRNLSFIVSAAATNAGNIKSGDVVRLHFDKKGRIDVITKVFSLDSFAPLSQTDYYAKTKDAAGLVELVDVSDKMIRINTGTPVSFRLITDSVLYYDKSEKTCEQKSIATLSAGNKVYFRLSYGQIAEIICVTE